MTTALYIMSICSSMFQTHSFFSKFKEYLKFRKLRHYVKWKEEEQRKKIPFKEPYITHEKPGSGYRQKANFCPYLSFQEATHSYASRNLLWAHSVSALGALQV